MTDKKIISGYIAIIGKANAGKSTLLNSLIEQKVSIVSPKPQTTRNKILGVWNEEGCQMIFVDTPGALTPHSLLGEYMVKSIESAVRDVDCILYTIDGHKGISESDIKQIERYCGKIPVVIAVTKTDICQPEKLMPELSKLNSVKAESIWAVSARKGKNIRELREHLKQFLTDDVAYFDKDDITDKSMGFMVCELIREKILLLLDEEIPHGVGVQLNKMSYDESRNLWDIDANIIVEKSGHKPIIIGRQGEKLKKIGSYARESIEKLTQGKVFLSLWVKVKEDWRNSEYVMKDIGYDKKQEF